MCEGRGQRMTEKFGMCEGRGKRMTGKADRRGEIKKSKASRRDTIDEIEV